MNKPTSFKVTAQQCLRIWIILSLLLGYLAFIPVQPGKASAAIDVNSSIDSLANDGFCTLREAVISANKNAPSGKKDGECVAGSENGTDTILLSAAYGDYVLTRTDNGKEDSSSTGDLDILEDLNIEATEPGVVIRGDSSFSDHIFQILSGTATFRDLTIQGGFVKGDGGGIYNRDTLIIVNSTISGNWASGRGGGIYNGTTGNLTLVNSTISGNFSQDSGGGLYNVGTADLNNVTISANTADNDSNSFGDGGGIAGQGGTTSIRNTIIAGNSDRSPATTIIDCSSTLVSRGYNLIGNSQACSLTGFTTGNILDVDPQLGPLQGNGGNTSTHALLSSSSAIDAGNPTMPGSGGDACASTDQRDAYRPRGSACDIGAFETGKPNASIIIRALSLSGGTSTTAVGRLSSAADLTFSVQFYSSAICDPLGTGGAPVGSPVYITTDASGNVIFNASLDAAVPQGQYLWAVTQDSQGNLSEPSACVRVGAGNDSWPDALQVYPENALDLTSEVDEYIDLPGQSRWYKFKAQPSSSVIVTLTGLPANYDLTLYKDISQAFSELTTTTDLLRLGAEFAPDAFTPDEFSPDAFTPDAFTPDAFTPDAFTPDAFTPDAFTPDAFTPDAFTPDAFTPDAFTSAQTRSLIAISAFNGLVGEGVKVNTWDNDGFFYVRVRGRNGVFDPDSSFHLTVKVISSLCSDIQSDFPVSNTINDDETRAGDYYTLILTDFSRMEGTEEDIGNLMARLLTFAAREEVAGKIIDLSQDARMLAANEQADTYPACPYAKNLVASAAKEIVDAYWDLNPHLQYIVIVGNDDVVPFFRHPDHALLGNERNYAPPVKDNTSSQASLKLGYVYSQDDYGARMNISIKDDSLPIPLLAVGRLVETMAEATAMLDAYLELDNTNGNGNGVVDTPTSALVTGYDFLEDVSSEVRDQLSDGLNAPVDTLITPRGVSPTDESSWTADQLRAALLNERHDLIFLAGHFSSGSALAADFTTRLLSSELASSSVDLKNAIIYSIGCHSGYNVVNDHGVLGVTREPDWAQAFARKQATLVAGTGYQYGDTDFIRYSEKIYLEFTKELRSGSGPVSIGEALVNAKRTYLASTPYLRGIDEKALLEATIFGLPMLSVDMTGTRLERPNSSSEVGATEAYTTNPGAALGLRYFDLTVDPQITQHVVDLQNVQDTSANKQAVYFSGPQGVLASPNEPILPHAQYNVSIPDKVLRGVGFRSATYQDMEDILPLTSAAATEIRGVHTPFLSSIFFPAQTWRVNYFDALYDGATLLSVFPVQFQSTTPASETGTLRQFDSMEMRLFYSSHIESYTTGSFVSTPALAAPPAIVKVTSQIINDAVHFQSRVVGNPAAGIQEVWITYTSLSGPLYSTWTSLDLEQNQQDSTLWEATLPLNGTVPGELRFIVQAVNGVGLVSMDTNQGAYYIPGVQPGNGLASTLEFKPIPGSDSVQSEGRYSEKVTFSASLTSEGQALADKTVVFTLGPQSRLATTNENGIATVTLSIFGLPGDAQVSASFAGDDTYQASFANNAFTISRQFTKITIDNPSASGYPEDSFLMVATLSDNDGILETPDRRLGEETLFFIVSGNGNTYYEAVITDYAGRAPLGPVPLPPGNYTVNAYFSGNVPLAESVTLGDYRYLPADPITASLKLLNHPPIAQDDEYQILEDETLNLTAPGVLMNDSDPEDKPLTVALVSDPTHGQLIINANGGFSYIPDQDFHGSDSFSYQANDGMDDSNLAIVTIDVTPVNDEPIAEADTYATDEDVALVVPAPGVLENDSDVDGDAMSSILVSEPLFGTLTLNLDGSFTYLPDPDFNGSDSFLYLASDGSMSSDPVQVNLSVGAVNDAPLCIQAIPSSDEIWSPNKDYITVTIQNVDDPEGDAFTLNITGVFQDEPVGKEPDAINIIGNSVDLLSDRDGNGDGRFYHLFFTATDEHGASCSGQVVVGVVAHDQSGSVSVDGGPLYDSTQPQ